MTTRLVDVDDLVTVDDIAERLSITAGVASSIVRRRGGFRKLKFPKPIVGCGDRAVWLWQDVAEWYESAAADIVQNRKRAANAGTSPYKQPSWSHGRKAS